MCASSRGAAAVDHQAQLAAAQVRLRDQLAVARMAGDQAWTVELVAQLDLLYMRRRARPDRVAGELRRRGAS